MHTAAIYISPNIAIDITDAHKNTNTNPPISIVEENAGEKRK